MRCCEIESCLKLKYEDSEDPQVETLLCFWDSGILRFSCFPRHTGAWSQRSSRSPPEAMAMAMCGTVVSVLVQFLWIFWSLAPHLRQAELDAGEVMPSAPGSNFLSDSWRHRWHSSESSLVLNIFGFFGRCWQFADGNHLRPCLACLFHGNRHRRRSAFTQRLPRLRQLRQLRLNRLSTATDPFASHDV